MQVLKFGGSSVASASTITKVINILKEASGKDKTIFVASAISGATDKLIEIGTLAGAGNKKYEELIRELETRHTEIITSSFRPIFNTRFKARLPLFSMN
jgi:aspartokinase/homoserine dehydrogenase 1